MTLIVCIVSLYIYIHSINSIYVFNVIRFECNMYRNAKINTSQLDIEAIFKRTLFQNKILYSTYLNFK